MSPDLIFQIATKIALAGWLLLAFVPKQSRVVSGAVIPLLLSLAYATLLALNITNMKGDFATLDGVMLAFTDRWMVLIGWIHYLAFDLFIGSWEARDAQQRGLSRWLVLPCLFLTLMFGPVGLLLYFALRRRLKLD